MTWENPDHIQDIKELLEYIDKKHLHIYDTYDVDDLQKRVQYTVGLMLNAVGSIIGTIAQEEEAAKKVFIDILNKALKQTMQSSTKFVRIKRDKDAANTAH